MLSDGKQVQIHNREWNRLLSGKKSLHRRRWFPQYRFASQWKLPRIQARIPDTVRAFCRFHHRRVGNSDKVHSCNCECHWSDSTHSRNGNMFRRRRSLHRNCEPVPRNRRRCNNPTRNIPGKVSYPNRRDFPKSSLRMNRNDKHDFQRMNHTSIHPNRRYGQSRLHWKTLHNVRRKKDFPGRIRNKYLPPGQ